MVETSDGNTERKRENFEYLTTLFISLISVLHRVKVALKAGWNLRYRARRKMKLNLFNYVKG